MKPIIEIGTTKNVEPWVQLRSALWPHHALEAHRAELSRVFLLENAEAIAFIARNAANEAIGLAEATLRHDYVNGCSSSPVLFLEGIYVRPDDRRKGIARLLCNAVSNWGKLLGCVEFGSDAGLENSASHALHAALGFRRHSASYSSGRHCRPALPYNDDGLSRNSFGKAGVSRQIMALHLSLGEGFFYLSCRVYSIIRARFSANSTLSTPSTFRQTRLVHGPSCKVKR